MPRISWAQLPATARAAVAEHTGPVHAAVSASGGVNSGIAARLRTSTGGVFVKGVPTDHSQIRTQQREVDINLHLPGFELLTGRTADFSPGSADLPKVVAALGRLHRSRRTAAARR